MMLITYAKAYNLSTAMAWGVNVGGLSTMLTLTYGKNDVISVHLDSTVFPNVTQAEFIKFLATYSAKCVAGAADLQELSAAWADWRV